MDETVSIFVTGNPAPPRKGLARTSLIVTAVQLVIHVSFMAIVMADVPWAYAASPLVLVSIALIAFMIGISIVLIGSKPRRSVPTVLIMAAVLALELLGNIATSTLR